MSFVKGQNSSVKKFRSFLCKENKSEYGLAFQDNPNRKGYTTGEELRSKFARLTDYEADKQGASKHSYILNYIVVKRYLIDGWTGRGNQIEDEIKFYLLHKNDEYSDCICPILRYGLHRGDRVESTNEKYLEECYIVSQRAIKTGNAKQMCKKAEEMNIQEGYSGEDADTRYLKLSNFSNRFNMWDVLSNCDNCGVIFDYEKNCYKAVCIDYAL